MIKHTQLQLWEAYVYIVVCPGIPKYGVGTTRRSPNSNMNLEVLLRNGKPAARLKSYFHFPSELRESTTTAHPKCFRSSN